MFCAVRPWTFAPELSKSCDGPWFRMCMPTLIEVEDILSICLNCDLIINKKSTVINPLNAELNHICHFLALLGVHHLLHVSRIRVKLLTLRLLMSYIYIYDISSLRVNLGNVYWKCIMSVVRKNITLLKYLFLNAMFQFNPKTTNFRTYV
jgi:hypothetical protein